MAGGWRATLLVACLQSLRCLAADPWAWAGVFSFPVGHYVWSAARNAQGIYQDPSVKLVVVAASAASSAGLHGAEASATSLWSGTAIDVQPGTDFDATNAAYRLVFDQRTWVTYFELHVNTAGAYAIFTEHAPTEFERGFHFLKTETGTDINAAAEEGGAHGHGHGSGHSATVTAPVQCPWAKSWEWEGLFEFAAADNYTWSASRGAGGAYADPRMKLVVVAAAGHTAQDLAATEQAAQALWSSTATEKKTGEVLPVGGAYTLVFDDHSWGSYFLLDMHAPGEVAFYSQHLPTEFEKDFHYLKNSAGTDVEPAVQASVASCPSPAATTTMAPAAASASKDKWGEVLIGSFLTCLPTLVGLLFVVPSMAAKVRVLLESIIGIINSFASGVIFAAAVFLLLPEALHLAGAGHEKEVVGTWTWGTSILVGWFSCYLVASACQLVGAMATSAATKDEAVGAANEEADEPSKERSLAFPAKAAIAGPVLLGDFFHNFSDGLILGVAFRVCGSSFGWEVVGVTVLHEAPQELADMVILVLDAGMKWHVATAINFLSSLSTVIGAIITYSAEVGSNEEGYILAYGAGVYIWVALTELGPRMMKSPGKEKREVMMNTAAQAFSFVLGCVLLGLVLLGHEHCFAPSPAVSGNATATGGAAPAASPSGSGHGHGH